MSKKVIGSKYGIQITRPWNNEMYDWNDEVAKVIKVGLYSKLEELYKKKDNFSLKLSYFNTYLRSQ